MSRRAALRFLVFTVLVLVALRLPKAAPIRRDLAAKLGRMEAPQRALGSVKLRRALLAARRLTLLPPDSADPCGDAAIGLRPVPLDSLPSSEAAPAPWRGQPPPLVSLWIEPCAYRRLQQNRQRHGRRFEETGWLSFFDGGELRAASAVGVRVHGGNSRRFWPPSFRLEFRSSYGLSALPFDLLVPGREGAADDLVLDNDGNADRRVAHSRFYDSITYDIVRLLGGLAPETRPILLSINGERPSTYVLLEHIGPAFLERRFGTKALEFVRGKGDSDSRRMQLSRELTDQIAHAPSPFTAESAARQFDLDSLVHSLVANFVCATGDPFQGVLVRDPSGTVGPRRWTYVNWDLDRSFDDPSYTRHRKAAHDVVPYFIQRRQLDSRPGVAVMRRLLVEDRAFRIRVAAEIAGALNHELAPEVLLALVDRYRRIGQELGVAELGFLDRIDDFFPEQARSLYRQMSRFLDVGAPQAIVVAAPPGSVSVDGRPVAAPYRGLYPAGLEFVAEISPAWRSRFLGWSVDGRPAEGAPHFARAVDRPMTIEPRFAASAEPASR